MINRRYQDGPLYDGHYPLQLDLTVKIYVGKKIRRWSRVHLLAHEDQQEGCESWCEKKTLNALWFDHRTLTIELCTQVN
jgi:hypothetical protein